MSPFDVIKTVRLTEKVMAVQEYNDAAAERLSREPANTFTSLPIRARIKTIYAEP